MSSRNTLEFSHFTVSSTRAGSYAMRRQSHNGKSPAVKLALPGNQAGNKAHWLARVECWLAHVERRLEPADQIDYLIRRSLLEPVHWGVPPRAGSVRASAGAEFDGRGPAGDKQLFGEQLIVS
jgi:hypothetical protein